MNVETRQSFIKAHGPMTVNEMKERGLIDDSDIYPESACYSCGELYPSDKMIADDDGDFFDRTCYEKFYHVKLDKKKETEMPTHNCWSVIDAVVGTSRRVLLFGLPGTGKTYAATKRSLTKGQKVYTITLTEETPAAELRGHFIPKAGEMVWMDGPAVRAWREGARLVINEINHASADTLSLLFAVLDDPEFAEFTLPTGETVRPADGFHVIATMNGEPEELPVALQDRFPVSIEVTDLNPEALNNLPKDLQEVAKNTALQTNSERRLSIRVWLEYATLRQKIEPTLAAKAIFGVRANEVLQALQLSPISQELDPTAPKAAVTTLDYPLVFNGEIYGVRNIAADSRNDLLFQIEAHLHEMHLHDYPSRPQTAEGILQKMIQEGRIPSA